jgi:hypothetical protein
MDCRILCEPPPQDNSYEKTSGRDRKAEESVAVWESAFSFRGVVSPSGCISPKDNKARGISMGLGVFEARH